MTLCIAHVDYGSKTLIVDCLREARPPFSPEVIASEFSAVLKSYRLHTAFSDRFGGDWVVEQFGRYGIVIKHAPKVKSACYLDLLASINSRRVTLLDHTRCFNQALALERRAGRTEMIDHPVGGHDDLINAVALVVSIGLTASTFDTSWRWVDHDDGDLPKAQSKQQRESEEARRRREEAESNYRWRMHNYFRRVGVF